MVPSTLPPELNQSTPRQVAPNRKMAWFSFGVPLLLLLWIFGTLGTIIVWPAMKQAVLKERGVDTVATIETITPQRTKSGGIFYIVGFHYTQAGQTQSVYQGNDKVFPAPTDVVRAGMTVPAIYDPQNPTNIKIDLDNRIRTKDPYAMLGIILIPIGGFASLMFLLIPGNFIYRYRREKKLLINGGIAIPTLTGETEYDVGKGRKFAKISYNFVDAQGQSVKGENKDLPAAEQAAKYASWQKKRDAVLKNPIVIYDPSDSSKNMLYPGAYAVCVEPTREWGK